MKIKKITKIKGTRKFCDISTNTGNFVLANSKCVVHNSHISTLLMVLFLKIAPQLVKNGNLYIAKLPLYGAMMKKKFIPLYTEEELNTFKLKNLTVKTQRYKGLGEMNPEQLKVCLLDPQRKLIQVTYPENEKEIFQLMIDASLKRKLINDEELYED